MTHKNNKILDTTNMKIYDYSYNVIEQDMELEITKEVLKMRNINYNNYDNFANKLSDITQTKGFMK